MGRGRADPLPPLECRLGAPPSSPLLFSRLPRSLPEPHGSHHQNAHTRAHIGTHSLTLTLPGGPAASLRAQRSRPLGLGEKRPFVIQITPSPRARAAGSSPGNPSIDPTPPGAPAPPPPPPPRPRRPGHLQLISGFPGPGGLRRAGRSAGPRLPRPRCALRLGARRSAPSPSPLPLPLPFLSPDQPRSCRRRRRLPRSAGALPAALPAAWHHRG